MSTNEESLEIDAGLYLTADLPSFDSRQSWKVTLRPTDNEQVVPLESREFLRLNRARQIKTPMSTSGSQVDYIQEVVQTSTTEPLGLKRLPTQMRLLKESIESVEPPSEILPMGFEAMKAAFEAERHIRINDRIRTIAGYIAARENLWVVTKHFPGESDTRHDLGIGLARLVGLALENEGATHAVPVVKGRNQKLGRLLATPDRGTKGNRGVSIRNIFTSVGARPSSSSHIY